MNNTIGLPFNFIVDPATMKICDAIQGFDQNIAMDAPAKCAQ